MSSTAEGQSYPSGIVQMAVAISCSTDEPDQNGTVTPTHTPFGIGNMTSTSAPVHHHHHGGGHHTSRSSFGVGNMTAAAGCMALNPADCPH